MLNRRILPGVLILAAVSALGAPNTVIKEQELVDVRSKIAALRESIAEKSRRRTRLDKQLRQAETALSEIRERLATIEASTADSNQRLGELARDSAKRQAELTSETEKLVGQLRAAYTSGRTERVRLALNLEDPAALGRTMTYYRYLNSYRQGNIDSVRTKLDSIVSMRAEEERTRNELVRLAEQQRKEQELRLGTRTERKTVLVKLNREIEGEGGQIAELKQRETDLQRLIVELSSILADYPISSERPFSELKGALTWPVAGRLIHDFGQPRADNSLRWNGVVMAAERGREVRALYHGRVAFSDWLPGLGLLIVIDHGDSYLSLYGHNDSLLKDVGAWVAAGDAIATIGDSGGQSEPALYLEIRHGREPLNPQRWVSKKPRRQN